MNPEQKRYRKLARQSGKQAAEYMASAVNLQPNVAHLFDWFLEQAVKEARHAWRVALRSEEEAAKAAAELKPSQVEVDASEWVRANGGRRPSGEGCWLFCKVDPRRRDYLDHLLSERGSYGAAKKAAQAKAAAEGVSLLWVCS